MKYEVYIMGKPETAKELEVTEEDLLKRYGHITTPTPMFLKDLACTKGLFSWRDYNKLRGRKARQT